MCISLTEMVHKLSLTPAVTDREIGYRFFNDNIYQHRYRAIDMRFYWVRDRV